MNGFKYGEIPPPPGQSRKWAWWEAPWYTFTILSYPLYYIMFFGKPLEAQGINYWGRPRAEEELETDHKLLDKLAADPELMARCRSCAEACGMIGDECYDLVFMRKEYMLQKKLHDGEWPQEVKDFLDELEA